MMHAKSAVHHGIISDMVAHAPPHLTLLHRSNVGAMLATLNPRSCVRKTPFDERDATDDAAVQGLKAFDDTRFGFVLRPRPCAISGALVLGQRLSPMVVPMLGPRRRMRHRYHV